jgi:hypothetical protein
MPGWQSKFDESGSPPTDFPREQPRHERKSADGRVRKFKPHHRDCKYHVVFIAKCRRKTLYLALRRHLGEVFRGWRVPGYLPKPQARRSPVMLDRASGLVAAQPCREVLELVSVRKDRRQTNYPTLIGVLAAQEALNLDLVPSPALPWPDHVAFVEHEQADVVEERRIVTQREVISGVATTMSRSRMASSSKSDTLMLP